MARNDGRVEKGQSIRSAFSAKAWNRAQDAADIVLGVQPSIEGGASRSYPSGHVSMLLKNESQTELDPYTVVELTGVLNQRQFIPQGAFDGVPVLTGISPTASIGQNYCVALHSIQPNQIGRVAVSGVVPCMVNTRITGDTYASIPDGQNFASASPGVPYLVSGLTGTSRILHKVAGRRGLTLIALHNTIDYVIARNTAPWPLGAKATLNIARAVTYGPSTIELDVGLNPAQIDAWNFLGSIDDDRQWNVIARFAADEYVLIQSSYFTKRRFDDLEARISALENA